jgi:hypothetical protein
MAAFVEERGGPFRVFAALVHDAKLSRPVSPAKGPFWIILRRMIGLTDTQLAIVMGAARVLPVEKRDTFLQRIAAMLALRGRGRFTDTDVADVAQLALAGLVQQTADSAAWRSECASGHGWGNAGNRKTGVQTGA